MHQRNILARSRNTTIKGIYDIYSPENGSILKFAAWQLWEPARAAERKLATGLHGEGFNFAA